eukprot:1865801-Pleurochrysis_carterae.AAC.1
MHYRSNRIIHIATEACTTVPRTTNCFAGAAYVYTVTPAKDDYGRRLSIEMSVQKHLLEPIYMHFSYRRENDAQTASATGISSFTVELSA